MRPRFKSIRDWVAHHYEANGEAWCYQNLQQCAIDLGTVSVNPESFSRTIRAVRRGESPPITEARDVRTVADSIEHHEVDLTRFDVSKALVNTWGDGKRQVKLFLNSKKESEIDMATLVEDFKKEVKEHKPVRTTFKRKKHPESYMFEIALPDVHASLLAWAEETGAYDYDLQVFSKIFLENIWKHLQYVSEYNIDKIMLCLNGDILNSDSLSSTTAHGTRQDDDSRFQKSFSTTWKVIRDGVEFCKNVADVHVVITSGNHDTMKAYMLGETLKAWFDGDPHVEVDNTPRLYKYFQYGKSMLGITHGHGAKIDKMSAIMATDVPEMWGQTKYREMHIGHLHGEIAKEFPGCTVRVCKAMSPPSAWTIEAGYRSIPASQSFLWHKELGNVAQFNSKSFE